MASKILFVRLCLLHFLSFALALQLQILGDSNNITAGTTLSIEWIRRPDFPPAPFVIKLIDQSNPFGTSPFPLHPVNELTPRGVANIPTSAEVSGTFLAQAYTTQSGEQGAIITGAEALLTIAQAGTTEPDPAETKTDEPISVFSTPQTSTEARSEPSASLPAAKPSSSTGSSSSTISGLDTTNTSMPLASPSSISGEAPLSSASSLSQPVSATSKSSSLPTGTLVGIVVGSIAGLAIILALLFFLFRRKKSDVTRKISFNRDLMVRTPSGGALLDLAPAPQYLYSPIERTEPGTVGEKDPAQMSARSGSTGSVGFEGSQPRKHEQSPV